MNKRKRDPEKVSASIRGIFKSSVARFDELRRGLPILAAALLLLAILLPMWRISLEGPQFLGSKVVEVYAYPRLGGDYDEVQEVIRFVGFHYPNPVFVEPNYDVHEDAIRAPEWILGPVVLFAVAATGVFVALAPTVRKLKLGLMCQIIGTVGVFAFMFAFIQYRLYQAGHSLGRDAQLVGVSEFTPPLLGGFEIAEIYGYAWFGPGAYVAMLAVILLALAFIFRDSKVTFSDLRQMVNRWV